MVEGIRKSIFAWLDVALSVSVQLVDPWFRSVPEYDLGRSPPCILLTRVLWLCVVHVVPTFLKRLSVPVFHMLCDFM